MLTDAEIDQAEAKARERLAPYEVDCLVDFAGIERRDVRWGAAMAEAVSSCVALGFLTRGPQHMPTDLGKAVAARLASPPSA